MKKTKISLVSLLLFVALLGAIVEITIRRIQNQSLADQRDKLLRESDWINATDTSKIYVRRLPSLVPMVFRFQVAFPLGKMWRIKNDVGELAQGRKIGSNLLLPFCRSGRLDLPYQPEETHAQGVVTVYISKQSGQHVLFESTENGMAGFSMRPSFDGWLDRLYKYSSEDFSRDLSKKYPVETFPVNAGAPLVKLIEPEIPDEKAGQSGERRKFINVSIMGSG